MTTQENQNQPSGDQQNPATQTPSDSAEASEQTSATTDLGGDSDPGTKPPEAAAPPAEGTGATDLGAEDDKPADGEEAPKPWAEFHGAPLDDNGAPIDYEIVAPDGLEVDEDLKSDFTPVARELNLSQKGAQKLIDLKAKDVKRTLERWGGHLKELKTDAMSDPEVGGSAYTPAIQRGRAVIKKFGTPELAKALNTYGLGAHKEFIRFCNRIAAATGETATPPPGAGGGATQTKPLHDILYKDT